VIPARAAGRPVAAVLAALCCCGIVSAQKDVTLETLARALEGRIGIYARNLTTGDEIAINADRAYPVGAIRTALGAESRPSGTSPDPTSEVVSPRKLAEMMKARHAALPKELDHAGRRALVCDLDASLVGSCLSPVVEVGGATTGLDRSPGVAGYAATKAGDLVFCVMASDLQSSYTAAGVFPEIIESLFRRLVPSFAEPAPDPKPQGLLVASIHERAQDPKLFPKAPDDTIADLRRGSQRLAFRLGDTARVAVLARPQAATRVTVQWWSPAQRAELRKSVVFDPMRLGDSVFDLPLDKTGRWHVRVGYGDVIVLDEKFFVTGK
jgi:hypothetical protein